MPDWHTDNLSLSTGSVFIKCKHTVMSQCGLSTEFGIPAIVNRSLEPDKTMFGQIGGDGENYLMLIFEKSYQSVSNMRPYNYN